MNQKTGDRAALRKLLVEVLADARGRFSGMTLECPPIPPPRGCYAQPRGPLVFSNHGGQGE